jgi:hypothetical protein
MCSLGAVLSPSLTPRAVIARYGWARSVLYCALVLLAIAYTLFVAVDAAIDDATALKRWVVGVVLGLVGRAMTLAAPKTTSTDEYGDEGFGDPLGTLVRWLPLPVARRVEFIGGVILLVAGVALALSSVLAL